MRKIFSVFIPVISLLLIGLLEESGMSDQTSQAVVKLGDTSRTDRPDTQEAAADHTAVENLRRLEEDLASCRLLRVWLELSELSIKYPQTAAGKRAQDLLKQGGMRVIDSPVMTSDNFFLKGVPYYRYSYGILISSPKRQPAGIISY